MLGSDARGRRIRRIARWFGCSGRESHEYSSSGSRVGCFDVGVRIFLGWSERGWTASGCDSSDDSRDRRRSQDSDVVVLRLANSIPRDHGDNRSGESGGFHWDRVRSRTWIADVSDGNSRTVLGRLNSSIHICCDYVDSRQSSARLYRSIH